MKKIILLIFILLFCSTIFGQDDEVFSEDQLELIAEIQAAIFNEDFDYALLIIDSLIVSDSSEPLWYTFQSAVFVAHMTSAEEDLYRDEIEKNHDIVDSLVKVREETDSDSRISWNQLCLGHMHAYKALREARFGSSFNAMKLGLKARNAYTKGLEYDPENYDLYGGIGMYHYWKSAKSGVLREIGIFSDDRDEGIEELYLALEESLFSNATAHNALMWIWFDKKEYDSVLAIAQNLYDYYPEGLTFLWPMAEVYMEVEDYSNALDMYLYIRERVLSEPGNYFNLIETDYNILNCIGEIGDRGIKDSLLIGFNSYVDSINEDVEKRQKDKIDYIKEWSEDN